MKTEEAVLKIAAPNHAAQLIKREPGNRGVGKLSPLREVLQVFGNQAYRSVAPRLTRAIRLAMNRCHPAGACQNRARTAPVEFSRGVTSYPWVHGGDSGQWAGRPVGQPAW